MAKWYLTKLGDECTDTPILFSSLMPKIFHDNNNKVCPGFGEEKSIPSRRARVEVQNSEIQAASTEDEMEN